MDNLENLIDTLSIKVTDFEKINTKISSVSVGWHIAHSTLVIKQIIEQLEKSDIKDYKWEFNLSRFFVFSLNKIPRGKGKAPKSVQIEDDFTIENLKKYLEIAKSKVIQINTLQNNSYFTHPFFGKLNLKASKKMLQIHTKHHIKIIEDIIIGNK
jgi:hypothetical protein